MNALLIAAILCLSHKVDKLSYGIAKCFFSAVPSVRVHDDWWHSRYEAESIKFMFVSHVKSKSFCGSRNLRHCSFFVIEPPETIGVHDDHEFLAPALQYFHQIPLALLFGDFVGMDSPFALFLQGEPLSKQEYGNGNSSGNDGAYERSFWSTYCRVLPWCLLLFGMSGYLCYRYGRWVGSSSSHE